MKLQTEVADLEARMTAMKAQKKDVDEVTTSSQLCLQVFVDVAGSICFLGLALLRGYCKHLDVAGQLFCVCRLI